MQKSLPTGGTEQRVDAGILRNHDTERSEVTPIFIDMPKAHMLEVTDLLPGNFLPNLMGIA